MENYLTRIIEKNIKRKLNVFGAINLVGPKWCGKTWVAKKIAKSSIDLSTYLDKKNLKLMFDSDRDFVIEGDKPRLIDEWQDLPLLWDCVRVYCDNTDRLGNFILTGSSSRKIETSHTGTGRILKIRMYPMSLYESRESTGEISIKDLFENKFVKAKSNLSLKDIIYITCRGGWPRSITLNNKDDKLLIVKDYYEQIIFEDMFKIDNVKRKSSDMKLVLKSYARNICTLAKKKVFLEDSDMVLLTLDDYVDVLKRLYIIEDIEPWNQNIRSASAIRKGLKRNFVDPSIAVAALNSTPEKLFKDLNMFSLLFESLCIRDLKIYSSNIGGEVSYYHDKFGLECDCVLTLSDGRYALIEVKLGSSEYIEEGCKNLIKIESLIKQYNKEHKVKMELPTFKMVLTNFPNSYITSDGIYVVPIGCLKD